MNKRLKVFINIPLFGIIYRKVLRDCLTCDFIILDRGFLFVRYGL